MVLCTLLAIQFTVKAAGDHPTGSAYGPQ